MLTANEMRRFNYRFAAKEIEIVENHIEEEAAKGKFETKFVLNVDPNSFEDNDSDTLLKRIEQCITSALITAGYNRVTSSLLNDKYAINLYIDWKNF